MRIATWNVNSLKARSEKLAWWLDRASPDILLIQETKLATADVPREQFSLRGYDVAHNGEGRWNGVAIASRVGIRDVESGLRGEAALSVADEDSAVPIRQTLDEARVLAATCGGIRVITIYAPNGRTVGSSFYRAKLAWFRALLRRIDERHRATEPLILGGDFNVAPDDRDVWDPTACHGGTHVSPEERAAFQSLLTWGLADAYRHHHEDGERYTWWDYRAGDFYKNYGMRIDHLLVTPSLLERVVAAEIDREARKGKPIPSDHAPLVVDIDTHGVPFDAGWAGADERIAARRAKRK